MEYVKPRRSICLASGGAEAMRGVGGQTITVQVPLKLKKLGGPKLLVTSDTEPWAPRPRVSTLT